MKKRALIYYGVSSIWESCTKIIPYLNQSYACAFHDENLKTFNLSGYPFENLDIAKEIISFNPDQLIFTDNRLNPLTIMSTLDQLGLYQNKKEHIIHIYGNPYYKGLEYLSECTFRFKGQLFSFRSSSSRFTQLLNSQFTDLSPLTSYLPYPLKENALYFDKAERANARKSLNISEQEKLIIYAGRISPGKNIDQLLEAFKKLHHSKLNSKFLLIGKFDDFESPFNDGYYNEGRYRIQISNQIHALKEDGVSITYLPHLNIEELKRVYLAADLQMSFSTSFGEDFGMSIAEGLQTGLPCLITDWAGYSDFAQVGEGVNFLKVNWQNHHLTIDSSILDTDPFLSDERRFSLSKRTIDVFSIEAVARKMKALDSNFAELRANKKLFLARESKILNSNRLSSADFKRYYEKYWI